MIVPRGADVFYDPFGVYAFSRNELVAMGTAVVATLALAALFRFSAIGLRMRAVVESPRMTELNGIAADRVSAFAWALSSLFAGVAGVLIAPRFNTLAAGDFFAAFSIRANGAVAQNAAPAGNSGLVVLQEDISAGTQRAVRFNLDNNVSPRMAYNHYFGKPSGKPAAKKA